MPLIIIGCVVGCAICIVYAAVEFVSHCKKTKEEEHSGD